MSTAFETITQDAQALALEALSSLAATEQVVPGKVMPTPASGEQLLRVRFVGKPGPWRNGAGRVSLPGVQVFDYGGVLDPEANRLPGMVVVSGRVPGAEAEVYAITEPYLFPNGASVRRYDVTLNGMVLPVSPVVPLDGAVDGVNLQHLTNLPVKSTQRTPGTTGADGVQSGRVRVEYRQPEANMRAMLRGQSVPRYYFNTDTVRDGVRAMVGDLLPGYGTITDARVDGFVVTFDYRSRLAPWDEQGRLEAA